MGYCEKSAENYCIAVIAFEKGKYNATANRLYYALYQACVSELTGKGKTLDDFIAGDRLSDLKSRKSDTDAPMWPHDVVTDKALSTNGLDLNVREKTVIRQSKALRVKGDYGDKDKVVAEDLQDLLQEAPKLLRSLGVAI